MSPRKIHNHVSALINSTFGDNKFDKVSRNRKIYKINKKAGDYYYYIRSTIFSSVSQNTKYVRRR